jgi:hypothetical protein
MGEPIDAILWIHVGTGGRIAFIAEEIQYWVPDDTADRSLGVPLPNRDGAGTEQVSSGRFELIRRIYHFD